MQLYSFETRLCCADGAHLCTLQAGRIYTLNEAVAAWFEAAGYAICLHDYLTRRMPMSYSYPARRVERVSDAAVEPVSRDEAKTFLRLDGTAEDALIDDLIQVARIAAEEQTGKALITQSWRITYDDCAPSVVHLPYGPVQSMTSVKTIAADATETTIAATNYHLNALQDLVFDAIPSGHQVQINYVAGYGDTASDVPVDIAQGILIHVAHLYEHRDSMTPPLASQLSYSYHREIRL